VGPDKALGEAKYYSSDEDIAVEEFAEWAYKDMTDKRNQECAYEDVEEEFPKLSRCDNGDNGEDVGYEWNQEWDYEDAMDGPIDWPDVYADGYKVD